MSNIQEDLEETELSLYNKMIEEIKNLNELNNELAKQNQLLNIMVYNTKQSNKKLQEDINRLRYNFYFQ